MSPGPLLLSGAVAWGCGILLGPRRQRTWLCLCVLGASLGLSAALLVLFSTEDWQWRSSIALAGEPLHLRLDGLSALFTALLCVVGGTGAAYASEYWNEREHPTSARRSRALWSAMVLSMGLVLLSSNGLHFLIAWELFALCGFFLVTLDREAREVRSAGWLYLAASHAGTLCLFAFFASLASRVGSWELGPMLQNGDCAPLFWLALLGFGIKAGFFPLHIWLPSAHANAPSHVSALMSGVAIKMGVYGIVRFSGWLPVPQSAPWVVIGLGAASALLGVAFALVQNDFKRLLAYCSVEHVGLILIGVGVALLAVQQGGAAWGMLALAGALLHVWNHGVFKALLFFAAGSVLHTTGTREMSRLGGLWRSMPWTATLFGLGAIGACGLPPMNGFASEWLEYLGLLEATASRDARTWAVVPTAILLALAGALSLAAFAKSIAVMYLGAPRTKAAAAAHECGPVMRAQMLLLAGLCAALGLAPMSVWPAVSRAVGAWKPTWAAPQPHPPLDVLGGLSLALVVVAVPAAALLWRLARANGMRRAPTWDCGYATPTARMQYTSGSFAGIAAGWFAWILRSERRLRNPRGPFPTTALRIERVPETVLERVVAPIGGGMMLASMALRRLQHGRLQAYVVYLLLGVAAVAGMVLTGGGP
jgi:hydrogenase-4 component B